MDKPYVLVYEGKDGVLLSLEFNLDIDYNSYNKTILSMYGKRIKRRYVYIKESDEYLSRKQFNEWRSNNG